MVAAHARLICIVAALAAGACNTIFGLDATRLGADAEPDAAASTTADAADGMTGDDGGSTNPLDRDGDTVLDAIDNCPRTANRSQHDEDADLIGDACDVCPHIRDPEQPDTSETMAGTLPDGVGDACDPFPTLGGDHIVVFDGFGGSTLDPAWTAYGAGTAHVERDHLVLGDPTVDGVVVAHERETRAQVHVIAPATITEIYDISWSLRSLGPLARFAVDKGRVDHYSCDLADRINLADPANLEVMRIDQSASYRLNETFLADVLTPSTSIHHIQVVPRDGNDGASITCTLEREGVDIAPVTAADTTHAAGSIGFRSLGLAVELPYIIAFDRD